VKDIFIYVEGGGQTRDLQIALRRGFHSFLQSVREVASAQGRGFQIVACGGRDQAYSDFRKAVRAEPDRHNILLVDAEEAFTRVSSWAHLLARDGWDSCGTNDDCCFLMVEAMENWLIGDVDNLVAYFGAGFKAAALPANPNIEQIPKLDVTRALDKATKDTKKETYAKRRDGAALLNTIDPILIRRKARECERLFATLEAILEM